MKGKWKQLFIPLLSVGAAFALGAGVGSLDVQTQSVKAIEPAAITTEDFFVRSVALRIADDDYGAGVRYKVVMKKSAFETNYAENGEIRDGVETGLLLVSSAALGNEALTTENAAVAADTTGEWYEVTYDGVEYMESVVYVYNIAEENYADNIIVRAYAKEGTTIEYSAQSGGVSLAEVATEAYGMDSSIATSLKDTYCKFTLTYYSGTNQDGTPIQYGNTQTVYWGDKLTAPTEPTHATDNTAVFEGWYNEAGTVAWDFANTKVLGNTRLFAKFSYDCLVTLDTVGGTLPASYVALEKGKYVVRYSGGSIDLPTPFKANCKFEGWYKNAAYTGNKVDAESFTCADNLTLYAKWSSVGYVYMHYGEAGSKFLRLEYPIGTELTLNELVEEFKQTLSVEDVPGYETYCLGTQLAVTFNYWGQEADNNKNTFTPAPDKYIVSFEDIVLIAVYNDTPAEAHLKYNTAESSYTTTGGGNVSYMIGNAGTPFGTYELTMSLPKGSGGGHGPAFRMYTPQADYQHEGNARYLSAVLVPSTGKLQVSRVNLDYSPVFANFAGSQVALASLPSAWQTYYNNTASGATLTLTITIVSSSTDFIVYFSNYGGNGAAKEVAYQYSVQYASTTPADGLKLSQYIDTGYGIRSTGSVANVKFSNISFTVDNNEKVVSFLTEGTCYAVSVANSSGKVSLPAANPTKASVTKANGNTVSYTFAGWELEDGTAVTADTVYTANTKVYAKFSETEMRNGMVVTYDEYGRAEYLANVPANPSGAVLDGLTADFSYADEYEFSFKMTYNSWSGSMNDFRAAIFLNSAGKTAFGSSSDEGSIWVNFKNGTLILGSKVLNVSKNNYEANKSKGMFAALSTDCSFKKAYSSFTVGEAASLTWKFKYGVKANNSIWIKFYVEDSLIYTYGFAADSETHTTTDGKTLNKVDGEIVWGKVCNDSNQDVAEGYFTAYANGTCSVARGSDVGLWAWGNNTANGGLQITEISNKAIL